MRLPPIDGYKGKAVLLMLFQGLDRLKRSVLMTTIVLMFIGIIFMIIPGESIKYISRGFGFLLLVALAFSIFNFVSSSKALFHHLVLVGGLVAGVVGALILTNDSLLENALKWLVGVVPIVSGAYGIYHALVFARRSGRKGWFVLVILSALLIVFGAFVFFNPWRDNTSALMLIIGGSLLFSSMVSGLSLIWIWPIHRD